MSFSDPPDRLTRGDPVRALTRRAKHWQNGIIEKSLVQPARSDPLAGFSLYQTNCGILGRSSQLTDPTRLVVL